MPPSPQSSLPASLKTAPVQEIFSSVQGEGIFVGKRQVFVRFAHCHLHCAYCDTPMETPSGQCHLETEPGTGDITYLPNPMSPERLFDALLPLLHKANHHSVSFTGGEPLLYHRFLAEVFPALQRFGHRSYLETSGTQPAFLEDVLPYTDILAMDIKLPSATGEADSFDAHALFYQLARQHQPKPPVLFIKLVFNGTIPEEELEAVHHIVTDRSTPIILQPMTPLQGLPQPQVRARDLFALEHRLSQTFADVRVIPQTHKMLKIL
jgi:organic radical activating enzyme